MNRAQNNRSNCLSASEPVHSIRKMQVIAIFALVLLAPAAAFAYIDPGTGSFLLQGILAVVVGAGITIKMYWGRIKGLFGKTSHDEDDDIDE